MYVFSGLPKIVSRAEATYTSANRTQTELTWMAAIEYMQTHVYKWMLWYIVSSIGVLKVITY